MRKFCLLPLFIFILILLSCQQKKDTGIVETVVVNKEHVQLKMIFDNQHGTATFILKGDTMLLKQDTMASGIKYSNRNYTYTEWHGRIDLYKNGEIIFTKKDD